MLLMVFLFLLNVSDYQKKNSNKKSVGCKDHCGFLLGYIKMKCLGKTN